MNTVLAILAGALLTSQPHPCTTQVQQLEDAFHATYSAPPAKPAQASIIGRDGQILDAATYRKRLAELAEARQACAAQTVSGTGAETPAGR